MLSANIRSSRLLFILAIILCGGTIRAQYGCTDSLAVNFDSSAIVSDGSCIYAPAELNPDKIADIPDRIRQSSGLLYYHDSIISFNDKTDNHLYIFHPELYRTISTGNTTNTDWEEIKQDSLYLYIGDIGNNNAGNRTDLMIYRIRKADLGSAHPNVDTIAFSYDLQTDFTPDAGNQTDFDCEAFIVTGEKIYLFTKEWTSKKTTVYELDNTSGQHIAKAIDQFDVNGLITGVEFFEDKKILIFSGYSTFLKPFLFLFYDFEDRHFFSGNKRKIELDLTGFQLEGIASSDGLHYYLSNEYFRLGNYQVNAQLDSIDLNPFLGGYLRKTTGYTTTINPGVIKNNRIKIYPNPGSGEIEIKSATADIMLVQVFNMNGKLVKTVRGNRLSVTDLPSGIYLIQVHTPEQTDRIRYEKL